MRRTCLAAATAAAFAISAVPQAEATLALTLTPAGSGMGFGLTTFVDGYPFPTGGPSAYGLVSIAVASNGKLLAPNSQDQKVYIFNDADNQTLGSAISVVPLPPGTGYVMATAGGLPYGAQALGGQFVAFSNSGSVLGPIVAGVGSYFGMWGNPVNGHIIASSNKGLIDITPGSLGSYTVINAGVFPDGVTVTPDGLTAYVADVAAGAVEGYDIATGAQVFNSGFLGGIGPDGMGVLAGTCAAAGDIVVVNNDGTVGLINPSGPPAYTKIAQGGTRGDFASLDTNNGTLFMSQNEGIARLTSPAGCTIGTVLTGGGTSGHPTPEPVGLPILAAGGLALVLTRRR